MLISLFLNLLGIVLFLFLFWRCLKEDYPREIVFGSAFLILLGVVIGYAVSLNYFPDWFFWLEAFGAFLGFSLGIFKYSLRFFEAFEAAFLGLLPWLAFLFVTRQIYISVFILGLITLSVYLKTKYKTFLWYKSGRIGLSGLLTAGVFFMARMVVAIFFPTMVSLTGKGEIILSGISAFTIFLLVYNLARSQT